jgi:hypothetical protein
MLTNAHICHQCPNANRTNWTCGADSAGGSISDHATAHDCPLSKFDGVTPESALAKNSIGTGNPGPYAKHHAEMAVKSFDGSSLWRELHTHQLCPVNERLVSIGGETVFDGHHENWLWINRFTGRVPCGDCRSSWRKWVEANPPDFSSQDAFFEWTVRAHNSVNRKLGRGEWTVENARLACRA